jgi:hypothetical protein
MSSRSWVVVMLSSLLMILSVPLSVVVLAESVSAQGGDNDKACTTSDASSTILTRIAHRTCLHRRTQGHYMPVPCPCRVHAGLPNAARARLRTYPTHTHTHTGIQDRTRQGIADNDKRYFQCCTPPLRSDTLGLRAPPPASLAIASLRLHVNSIPPACCQRRQRAVYNSPLSSWRCGDAKCALYRQHSARRPSRATYEVGCHSCRWPSEGRRREDVAAVRKNYYNRSPTPAGGCIMHATHCMLRVGAGM